MRRIFSDLRLTILALGVMILSCADAYAASSACTPGIPCTTYTLTDNPDAGTNPSFNAWKSGQKPPFSGSTCDGNYMNQMIGQAYMTAQREVVMNSQIVRKPDSVLEYSCFDQYLGITGTYGGTLTESQFWEGQPFKIMTGDNPNLEVSLWLDIATIPGSSGIAREGRIEYVLNELLVDTMRNYIQSNFSHSYLGGSSGIDTNMNLNGIVGNTYNCNHMSAVWELSKCNNFGADDNFLSFGQLVTGDPRQLPAACNNHPAPVMNEGAPPAMGGIDIASGYITAMDTLGVMTISETDPCPDSSTGLVVSRDQIRLSNNCDKAFSATEVAMAYLGYMRDPYFLLDYPEIGILSSFNLDIGDAFCGPALPTGVMVAYYEIQKTADPITGLSIGLNLFAPVPFVPGVEYEEHFCLNPSCHYLPGLACVPSTTP